MDIATFASLMQALTGRPVKGLTDRDKGFLERILKDEGKVIDCCQFNELLLLVNKDRVEPPFFDYFFRKACPVSDIRAGVERFQKMAMLCYGNFVFAYRKLSRLRRVEKLVRALGAYARDPQQIATSFAGRGDKLIEVELIKREQTPLVGYLSAGEIVAENKRAAFLRNRLPPEAERAAADWSAYEATAIEAAGTTDEHRPLRTIIANYRAANQGATVAQFAKYLDSIIPRLEARLTLLNEVRAKAERNQDVYLTWDHMDVYFATSMRRRWEFEDLFDFVTGVMGQEVLKPLKLRHFDPTQSYTGNRINKGLVESLMLKRAECTVYSVQDTDTLGKDSELAATLAQGKPVIAYVPRIDIEERVGQLLAEDPVTIQDRLRFVIYADEYFASHLTEPDLAFVRDFHALETFEQGRIWRSIPDQAHVASFQQTHQGDLERICRIIAASEARIYDKRAKTLTESHPLAIQVHLDTGVANGVLVVRTKEECAELLRRVLTNTLVFELQEDKQGQMWHLREIISGCVFKVVSKDPKLTNCFWNFYRPQAREE